MSRSPISATTPPRFNVWKTRFTLPTLTGANVSPWLARWRSISFDTRGCTGSVSANTGMPMCAIALDRELRIPHVRAQDDRALAARDRGAQMLVETLEHETLLEELFQVHMRKVCDVSVVQRHVAEDSLRGRSALRFARLRHDVPQVLVDVATWRPAPDDRRLRRLRP